MHTASKVMLILGAVITVAGIVMFAVGSSAVAWDPIGDAEWEGKSGTFNDDATLVYSVYSEASSCDSITYTILDGDNSAAVNQEYDCDDSTQSADGYIYLGSLWSVGPYTIDSTETVYISDSFGDIEEAAGGFLAVLGSFGVLCCGGFFLLLGGIFALTLKDPAVVMVAGGVPQQMMGAQQYAQPMQMQQQVAPVQQQAAPVQQQYQQPPQGGL
ncbi:MAG: hypothetical protein ACKVKS_06900 [Candidatus Poseidoniales archaeon]